MDKQAFQTACEKIIDKQRTQNGIGTLGEKTLHAVLKLYFEPSEANHEVKIGPFVADIVTDKGIIEIQTRNFNQLRKKLAAFLEEFPVTVVYPIPHIKWLLWIDEASGTVTQKRKSPKQGRLYDAVFELYRIKPLLDHPNLRLCFVFIDLEEYRYLNGWSRDKKRGSTRCDRIPVDIVEEVTINSPADYTKFLPEVFPQPFTSKDFQKAARTSLSAAQQTLHILHHLGIVKRVGKQRKLYLYERMEYAEM